MYKYARTFDITEKDCSLALVINKPDDEHGETFSEAEADLKILWDNKDDEIVEFLLIMYYSGYRISAYQP